MTNSSFDELAKLKNRFDEKIRKKDESIDKMMQMIQRIDNKMSNAQHENKIVDTIPMVDRYKESELVKELEKLRNQISLSNNINKDNEPSKELNEIKQGHQILLDQLNQKLKKRERKLKVLENEYYEYKGQLKVVREQLDLKISGLESDKLELTKQLSKVHVQHHQEQTLNKRNSYFSVLTKTTANRKPKEDPAPSNPTIQKKQKHGRLPKMDRSVSLEKHEEVNFKNSNQVYIKDDYIPPKQNQKTKLRRGSISLQKKGRVYDENAIRGQAVNNLKMEIRDCKYQLKQMDHILQGLNKNQNSLHVIYS